MIGLNRKACLLLVTVAGALLSYVAFAEDSHQHHNIVSVKPLTQEAAAFRAENEAAMEKMMTEMEVEPSNDVDRDFVAMMAPHHQGAIDMAVALLKYGKNEQLKRLAQEIIVEQQQEIAVMRKAVGQSLPPGRAVPTQIAP